MCRNWWIYNRSYDTYVHPQLIPHIAYWISYKFAVFIGQVILDWRKLSVQNEFIFWSKIKDASRDSSSREFKEKYFQSEIAKRESGLCEIKTQNGYIDILTDTKVIEVKTANMWKHAVGQVIIYGLSYPQHEKWIYLFDHEYDHINKQTITQSCLHIGVNVRFV